MGTGDASERLGTEAVVPWIIEWPDGTSRAGRPDGHAGHRPVTSIPPRGARASWSGCWATTTASPATTWPCPTAPRWARRRSDDDARRLLRQRLARHPGRLAVRLRPGQTHRHLHRHHVPQRSAGRHRRPGQGRRSPRSARPTASPTRSCCRSCIVDASPDRGQAVLEPLRHAQTVRTVRYALAHHRSVFKTSSSSTTPTTSGSTGTQPDPGRLGGGAAHPGRQRTGQRADRVALASPSTPRPATSSGSARRAVTTVTTWP